MKKIALSLSTITLVLGLAACAIPEGVKDRISDRGQYWQRINVAESTYLLGQKAQETLNKDIAQCIAELRELERLGATKNAIPADLDGKVKPYAERRLDAWDTPARDHLMYSEVYPYNDFEGCMYYKGWERVLNVPYDVAQEARDNYFRAHINLDYLDLYGGNKAERDANSEEKTGLND